MTEPPPGARTEPPRERPRKWRNPATGDVRIVADEGIDPGWDYNVGAVRALGVNRALGDRLESILAGRRYAGAPMAARERIAERMLDRHIHGPGFAWFIERPRARIENPLDSDDAKRAKMRWEETQGRIQDTPVGLLSPAAAQATGMPRVARLNERVAHKEEIHHPELTIAFWQAVPGVLARETPAPAGDRRWRFEGRRVVDGRELLVRVVVEADKDTGYAVVVSGHYTTKKKRPAG